MKLKIYAHLSVLFEITALIFMAVSLILKLLLTYKINVSSYLMILVASFILSKLIIHLFLQIRVIPLEES
jgi:hypothetical protein